MIGVVAGGVAPAARADDATTYQSVVTATRTPATLAEVPAAVTVIDRGQLDATPDKLVDEALRDVPSFGAYRRTSSAVADPTSQGLNLRGVGPSGVSRGLVLVDGIPETDAFGGWVYWRSLPSLSIDRIEIVPGGGSALWGNYALGGVINVVTRAPTSNSVDVDTEAGSENTARVAARVAQRWRVVGLAIDGEYLRSDGYQTIAPDARGLADHSADSDHANVNARLEVYAAPRLRLFASGGYFHERANGGTEYSTSTVQLGRYAAGLVWSPANVGRVDAAVFGHVEEFDQQRPRVNAMRSTAVLAAQQLNPTTDVGESIMFTSRRLHFAGEHTLSVGQDFRWIDSAPRNLISPAMVTPSSVVESDVAAQQLAAGLFAQDFAALGRYVDGELALRGDYWSNRDVQTSKRLASGSTSSAPLADRDGWQWSPRLGLVVHPLSWLALRASAYRSFRAPSINELYRPFQVGTITTDPNAALVPETLYGGELGVGATLRHFDVRATGFANLLLDPVSNVTLAHPLADGAQRQRQNLGAAQIVGLELAASWAPSRRWRLQVAYTFVDATVKDAPAEPQLVGKQLAEDPHHRLSTSVMFSERRWFEATIEMRYTSGQFDDDVNQLPMPGYVVVNAQLARRLLPHVDAFVAVENALNQQYLTGRSGVDTVGEPLFAYGGIRYRTGR